MMRQLFNGFRAMHELNAIHGNIKLPNILINKGELKIADFGFREELDHLLYYSHRFLPTQLTKAPEILGGVKYGL